MQVSLKICQGLFVYQFMDREDYARYQDATEEMIRMRQPRPLPPMKANMGISAYPAFEPLEEVMKAVKRGDAGESPTDKEKADWPGLCRLHFPEELDDGRDEG